MKFRLALALLFVSLPAFGTSISCPSASLQTYESPGFACRQGPLTFSNFTFSAVVTGEAELLTPAGIWITPMGSQFGAYGFNFNGDFSAGERGAPCGINPDPNCPDDGNVTPGGSQTENINYTIKGPVASTTIWLGNDLEGTDFGPSTDSWYLDASFDCPGQRNCVPHLFSGNFFNPWSFPDTGTCAAICTSLGMANTLSLSTDLGNWLSAPNGFYNYFSAAPPVSEPASLLLLGSGLLGLAGALSLIRVHAGKP